MHEGIYFKTVDSKKYRAIAKPLSNPPPFTDCLKRGQYILHTARDWKSFRDRDTFSKPGNSLIH